MPNNEKDIYRKGRQSESEFQLNTTALDMFSKKLSPRANVHMTPRMKFETVEQESVNSYFLSSKLAQGYQPPNQILHPQIPSDAITEK